MEVLLPLLYLYLGIGILYALYIWLFAGDAWTAIPVNILGGPIVMVSAVVRELTRKYSDMKGLFKHKKGVIFDLDGTIIDSQPFRNQAMENVLASLKAGWIFPAYPPGLNEREKWSYIMKNEPEFKPNLTIEQLSEKTKQEYLKLHQNVEVIPGFWELVRYFKETKKFKIGLATNSERDVVMEILKRFSAEGVFDYIATASDAKRHKPYPDIYIKVLKELKLRPKDVVAFEDTIVGAKSARGAGLDTIVIWDGEDEDPDDFPPGIKFFLSDFTGLSDAIEKDANEQMAAVAEELKNDNYIEAEISEEKEENTENTKEK